MNFVSMDFETANARLSSICQIGLVVFRDGKPVDRFSTYIDPEDEFDGINVSIHGIDASMVAGAPTFRDAASDLHRHMDGSVVITHTSFDRTAYQRASARYGIEAVPCRWLDSSRVARRAWEEFAYSGYGLANLARFLGIEFKHHDASEDARACGEIVMRAITHSGLGIDEWCTRVNRPIVDGGTTSFAQDGNPDGHLNGEVIVFTGALTMPRREAAQMAAAAGCDVGDGVTKETTLLVVGDQDATRLAGHEKSSKHRKAEALIEKGHGIRIITESDFMSMASAG